MRVKRELKLRFGRVCRLYECKARYFATTLSLPVKLPSRKSRDRLCTSNDHNIIELNLRARAIATLSYCMG
jgi:hypothetical protein